jgi:hypothetical protein
VAPQAKGHNSTKQVRTLLIATPNEILWKGLEIGVFDRWLQQRVKRELRESSNNSNKFKYSNIKLRIFEILL